MRKTLRRLVASGATVALATVGVQMLATGSAFARAAAVTGSATCEADGTYTVTWTIANGDDRSEVSRVTGHAPADGTVTPSSVHTDRRGSATVTETGISGSATSASLTVSTGWSGALSRESDGHGKDSNTHSPDNSTHSPDNSTHSPDNSTHSPDNSTHSPDNSTHSPDNSTHSPDNSTHSPDNSTHSPDNSTHSPDNSTHSPESQGSVGLEGHCLPRHVPSEPNGSDGSCNGHAAVSPSITFPSDAGVTYRIVGEGEKAAGRFPEAAGQYEVIAMSTAYTLIGTTSWTLHLAGPAECNGAVVPVSPVLTQSSCVDGSPTAPSLAQVGNDGIAYTVSPEGPYSGGQTVTVIAKAQPGYRFTTVPAGWSRVNTTTATYLITFAATPTCTTTNVPPTDGTPGPVNAGQVAFTDNACAGSGTTGSSYTIPALAGVDYYVGNTPVSAGTHPATDGTTTTVTARPQPGYTLTGATSWAHSFPATPTCSGIEGVTVTGPPHQAAPASAPQQPTTLASVSGLASTGVPVAELLLVGAVLLLLGTGGVALTARRRRSQG